MSIDFIKEMTEQIGDLEKKMQEVEDKLQQLANERDQLEARIIAGHDYIRDCMTRHDISSVTPENLKIRGNKSYPEMLIEIAQNSNGILNVSDAVEVLLKGNVGLNKKAIQHNVYNAIARGHFVKIKRGQYRFTNHVEIKTRKKQGGKKKERSGVQKAIKELKDKNPQLTKKEVLNHLLTTGFDFKGRKPTNAVNIIWAKLGYSKEGKQQPLLDVGVESFAK